MSIKSRIISVLECFGFPVVGGVYQGNDLQYFTFWFSTTGDSYADDEPQYERYLAQIHFFCPLGENTESLQKEVKKRLFEVDFSWPKMTDATDVNGQHLVFECEAVEGVETDGQA